MAKERAGFTDEERAAMKERARESRRRSSSTAEEGEAEVLGKIAEMAPADRALAERVHAVIKAAAPELAARTWYGMPAYAKDGKVVCYFQNAGKFKARYSTLGFSDSARLDEGAMWPNAYALTQLSAADEERITALVRKAVG
jgi:hypothetical protein